MVTYLISWLHRRREEIIAEDANLRIDTQRRQQDGVRVLAEAACELRRRLDLGERRTRGDPIPCRAEPEIEVETETREHIEASGKGVTEVYVYALKVSARESTRIWGQTTHRNTQLFMLLMCLIPWWWRNPVPTLVR